MWYSVYANFSNESIRRFSRLRILLSCFGCFPPQIILTLLENGCNPEITDNEGLTAEELAVKCGNTTAAAILRGEITSLVSFYAINELKKKSSGIICCLACQMAQLINK